MIFFSKSKKRRKRKQTFLRNLIIILVSCLAVYHGLSYLCPENSSKDQPSQIVATIKPQTVIPLAQKQQLPSKLILLVAPATQQTPKQVDAISEKVNQLISQGKIIQARTLINESNSQTRLAVRLGKKTILSPQIYSDDPLCTRYKVKPGDLLVRIAKKCDVPYQLICRINNIDDPRRLRAGQTIKLIKGPVNLKVIVSKMKLYAYLQDTVFAEFDVGLGKNDNTPLGRWLVVDRVRKPVYCDPETNKTYAPNDPDNPTGGYWIRLKGIDGDALGKTGFGIHGTNEPESIGKFMSKGCIRLRNEDMSLLFDLPKSGKTTLQIIP